MAMTTPSLEAVRVAGRRRIDPLSIAAAVFFLLAIGAAAYPAFRAGPTTGPGLLLLMGLAGVAFAGIYAFASSEPRRALASDDGLHALVDALAEPAAVTAADGRLVSFNVAWRNEAGVVRRLAREGAAGKALYAALALARRTGAGEARFGPGAGRPAMISRLGDDKLLLAPGARRAEVGMAVGAAARHRPRADADDAGRGAPRRWTRSPPPRPSAPPCWKAAIPSRRRSSRPTKRWRP